MLFGEAVTQTWVIICEISPKATYTVQQLTLVMASLPLHYFQRLIILGSTRMGLTILWVSRVRAMNMPFVCIFPILLPVINCKYFWLGNYPALLLFTLINISGILHGPSNELLNSHPIKFISSNSIPLSWSLFLRIYSVILNFTLMSPTSS